MCLMAHDASDPLVRVVTFVPMSLAHEIETARARLAAGGIELPSRAAVVRAAIVRGLPFVGGPGVEPEATTTEEPPR